MNTIIMSRILELSETRSRFDRVKRIVTNWKYVVIVSMLYLTAKVAIEQIIMLVRV